VSYFPGNIVPFFCGPPTRNSISAKIAPRAGRYETPRFLTRRGFKALRIFVSPEMK